MAIGRLKATGSPSFSTAESWNCSHENLRRAVFSDQAALIGLGLPVEEQSKRAVFDFLDTLQDSAGTELERHQVETALSEDKKIVFGRDVCNGLEKALFVRKLIGFFGDQKNAPVDEHFGFSEYHDRALFFDNWPVRFLGCKKYFYKGIARGEDKQLLETMCRSATSTKDDVDSIVRQLGENQIIIISSIRAKSNFSEKSKSFIAEGCEKKDRRC